MPEDMFDRQAARYDAWYETERGATILSAELSALRPLLAETGLCPVRTRSALREPPEVESVVGHAREGDDPVAGFTAILCSPSKFPIGINPRL